MAKKQTRKNKPKKVSQRTKARKASASKLSPEKRRERARRAAVARWRKVFLVLGPE